MYHCEIHPSRTAKISVNTGFERGNNFILAPTLNLIQHDRTLLDFRPLSLTTESTTPITYNIAISDKSNATTTFSRSFFVISNDDLQLELIPRPDQNTTTVYGPDFSDPVTAAYYAEGDFMKPGNNYTIAAEITSMGTQIPSERIVVEITSQLYHRNNAAEPTNVWNIKG